MSSVDRGRASAAAGKRATLVTAPPLGPGAVPGCAGPARFPCLPPDPCVGWGRSCDASEGDVGAAGWARPALVRFRGRRVDVMTGPRRPAGSRRTSSWSCHQPLTAPPVRVRVGMCLGSRLDRLVVGQRGGAADDQNRPEHQYQGPELVLGLRVLLISGQSLLVDTQRYDRRSPGSVGSSRNLVLDSRAWAGSSPGLGRAAAPLPAGGGGHRLAVAPCCEGSHRRPLGNDLAGDGNVIADISEGIRTGRIAKAR